MLIPTTQASQLSYLDKVGISNVDLVSSTASRTNNQHNPSRQIPQDHQILTVRFTEPAIKEEIRRNLSFIQRLCFFSLPSSSLAFPTFLDLFAMDVFSWFSSSNLGRSFPDLQFDGGFERIKFLEAVRSPVFRDYSPSISPHLMSIWSRFGFDLFRFKIHKFLIDLIFC